MKKVYLLSTSLQESVQDHSLDNSYSLGLAYLHSIIKKNGYDILTQNFNNEFEYHALEKITKTLEETSPDYLLIQVFTMTRASTYRLISVAKKIQPNIKIILGGVHATIMFEQILDHFPVDFIVCGEGEITIIELLEALDENASISDIPGIAYLKDGKVHKTNNRALIEDLDSIPFPEHSLFITPKTTLACMLTSRGCPFKCSFCCLHTISKRIYRKRSVDNIIKEIEYITQNFKNIKVIQIADDTFTLDIKRAKEICREIIRKKIKMEFWCSARFKPMDKEMFELMAEAGFSSIGFGLETGSPKLLKSIHKNISQSDIIKTFETLKTVPINVTTFLMVGFPGEDAVTIKETIAFVKKLIEIKPYKLTRAVVLWVYPNTEVYDEMLRQGGIDQEYWLTTKDVPYYTIEHPFNKLKAMGLRISYYNSRSRQILFYYGYFLKRKFIPALRNFINRKKIKHLESIYK